ncbi:hypothetical protein BRADI_2g31080v3 [Brachypodium distachyon]|uniref:Uncharacterized protein n=1 Tax=Brachypodium distachyon TaxID=15368 RepID=I1HKL6_BRADI|nr:hypothetical protein BRADI_2g31080v3 [Brachypodium distachyon]
MLHKSASQKTLRDVMLEERTTTMASRLLSPDLSNPSFRNYYGVASAGSVPFLWESAPGTPKKDAISSRALPPLTPPPSYYSKATCRSKSSKKLLSSSSFKPAASFVHSMFRRSQTMPSPSRPKDQSQSVVDQQCSSRRKRLVPSPSPRSSFSSTSRGEDEEGDGAQDGRAASPTSTLCFRARHTGQPGSGGGARRLLASVLGGHGNAAS